MKHCKHGVFEFLENDILVGRSLNAYGEFSEHEVRLYQQLIKEHDYVVEVGSNIGAHTIPIAKMLRLGHILAFEPQRILYDLLRKNIRHNYKFRNNVLSFPYAVGNRNERINLPTFDYSHKDFYSSSLVWDSDMKPMMIEGAKVDQLESVQMVTLDSFQLHVCDFLKVDVDGCELEVLEGAQETIRRCSPIIYIENDREDRSAKLIEYIQSFGYDLWWDICPAFFPVNFFNNSENVFPPAFISVMMLCIPKKSAKHYTSFTSQIADVKGPDDTWKREEVVSRPFEVKK